MTSSGEVEPPVEVVIFDLGGVILDLAGLRSFLARHELDVGEFFVRALGSGAHHAFERGALGADEYASAFLAEAGLDRVLDADEFLREFVDWPGGLLPGATELAGELRVAGRVVTATMSNTNPLHWEASHNTDVVMPLFDRHFPSYQFGMAKPDPDLFRRVIELLDVPAGRVVFFDDNQVNVDAAASIGIRAHRVDGPHEARSVLAASGVLGS